MQQLPKQSTEAAGFDMDQVHPLYFLESEIHTTPAISPDLKVSVTTRPMADSYLGFWDLRVTFNSQENNFRADLGTDKSAIFYGNLKEMLEFLTRYLFIKVPYWATRYKAMLAESALNTQSLPY